MSLFISNPEFNLKPNLIYNLNFKFDFLRRAKV